MKRNKLLMLFAATLLWLGGQSASAVTLTAVAGNHWGSNESPVQLVDGKKGTKWGNGGDCPHYAIFKSDLPLTPASYVLRIANDTNSNTGRNWKSWKIYGGNFASDEEAQSEAAVWNLIDTQTDVELPTAQYEECTITVSGDNSNFYSYFKIVVEHLVSDGQYMQMDEFWFKDYTVDTSAFDEQIQNCKVFDLTGVDEDITAEYNGKLNELINSEDPAVIEKLISELNSLQAFITEYKDKVFAPLSAVGESVWGDGSWTNLIDGNMDTKCGGGLPAGGAWLVFRANGGADPFVYTLTTGKDTKQYPGRNWKSWKIYGANFATLAEATRDAEGWVLLDSRENVGQDLFPAENLSPAAFSFSEFPDGLDKKYYYFRVELSAAYDGTAYQMTEIEFLTKQQVEDTRKSFLAEFDDFDVEALNIEASMANVKAEYLARLEELKTTSDVVAMSKAYNALKELRKQLQASADYVAGDLYKVLSGNTAWGDGENWTKLLDGDISTKWGGGMPEDGSYVIFRTYAANTSVAYTLVTGNDTGNSPGRNWKTWKIYGANIKGDMDESAVRNFSNWKLIDQKSDIGQDQLPPANFAPAFFSFSEEWSKYKYFKIEVEAAYDGGNIQMSEFKMYSDEEWKLVCQEYADSLNRLLIKVIDNKPLTEPVATEVSSAITAVSEATPEELLTKFAAAHEVINNALKKSYAEVAAGDADCILPSMKWGGDYKAFTYLAQGDFEYGDWNDQNPNYNKIIGVPEAQDGKDWYSPDYAVGSWNYGPDLPNFGDGRPADVYAVRYFTVNGEIPSTVYMPAAHDDAPCEYYINGELIWAETDGWKEDEVVRLTDSQKALIKTDGSVNVFAFHVHQNWGGRYADGGLYTAGNMVNDFNNTAPAVDATLALAEKEGIDAEVIEFAKSKVNYRAGRDQALTKLRQARRFAADSRTENFKGTAPTDGLTVYIFNVGAKMFLAGGNDWGTHASLNHMGAKCVLRANSSGENRYAIKTNLPNGSRNDYDGLGHNGYVDCQYGADFTTAEGWAWTFEALEDGTYHIINSQNSGANIYLGMTDDDRLQVDTDKSGADNPFNKWLLVTPEEFLALAEEATAENPVDLGHLIHQATFSQNDFEGDDKGPANLYEDNNEIWEKYSKWERNAGSIWNYKGNAAGGDYMFEQWNTADRGKVYLIQEVEGLPAGKYTVSMNGYYRDGNYEDAIGGNVRQLAYLFAGSEENCVPLASIMEGEGNAPGYGRDGRIPDGCYDAAKFFQVGTYTNTIDAVVGADGKLKIGVFRDAEDVKGGDWITTDNWRLFYKGNSVDVTISDAGYATFVAPGYIDEMPEGVEAFAAKVQEGYVHLEPVTAIPTDAAVVLKGDEGTYSFYPKAVGVDLVLDNDLVAAKEEVTANGGQFILAKLDGKAGFAKAAPGTVIPAGKGYLVFLNAVKAFYPFGEEETGIENVNANLNLNEGPIYNIAGQRVNKAQKGIYIINGKKILK